MRRIAAVLLQAMAWCALSIFIAQASEHPRYSIADTVWPEAFGNHRAVLRIDHPAPAVRLDLLWRRHDAHPELKRLVIVHAETGDTIRNISRVRIDNERCDIVFGPAGRAGVYYLYYLPYEVMQDWGYYDKDYLKPELPPAQAWRSSNHLDAPRTRLALPRAHCLAIQSRTQFDSFFPMEVIPTSLEKKKFLGRYTGPYLVFPEDRLFPIRMQDEIPLKWIEQGPGTSFKAQAHRNEYFAFQLGVYAVSHDLRNVTIDFGALTDAHGHQIAPAAMTCFNTGGMDPYGRPFIKIVNVPQGHVQALWVGVDIPEAIAPGIYAGNATLHPANAPPETVSIELTVNDSVLADRGDGETWRHSRLRWLNSTIGIDNHPVAPYTAMELTADREVHCLGRSVHIGETTLPRSITAWGQEILSSPVTLNVESGHGSIFSNFDLDVVQADDGLVLAHSRASGAGIDLAGTASMEFDGYTLYRFVLRARDSISLRDIRLEIPLRPEAAKNMMGMGLPGMAVPESCTARWDGPYDSFWIGNTHGGISCELRGAPYTGPLLNLYHPDPPDAWNNGGKGGISIVHRDNSVIATAFTGRRTLKPGDSLALEFAFLITPVKLLDTRAQFTNRYYHNGGAPVPDQADFDAGVKIVNVHHANEFNPYINYPFIAQQEMKGLAARMHQAGAKMKIYYTIRELTNHVTEFWALRSLGDEILSSGEGGGFPWLREHLIGGYYHQWYQHYATKSPDASLLTSATASRWYNYYIEGLGWLVKNMDIDGLYLDDVAYDRRILKRMRKVMAMNKPGCLIDLHSNTGFSKGPATQYTEFFPYVDKLWFGESFRYNEMSPDAWLVETSGIPFGLTGDMLQDGGNRWLGMVYGMSARLPWVSEENKANPRPVWKIWDQSGIADATMIGYWEGNCPVRVSNPAVRATVYRKKDRALIALGNWGDKSVLATMQIDWKALGLDSARAQIAAPEVEDFQPARSFRAGEPIPIEPEKGWLIEVTAAP